jgi:CHAD domain-containing protein
MKDPAKNGATVKQQGVGFWMAQVVQQAEIARQGFEADPVHDLRVAIRRCRSIAEGFVPLDPHPLWKKMRKSAKPLFAALGELRDTQVLMDWVRQLSPPDDPVRIRLLDYSENRESQLKLSAENALADFDLEQWSEWGDALEERARQLPPGGEVFRIMALQRWIHARELQAVALRNRSNVSLHALRIGLKKFRYLVENFLPDLHENWQRDLKSVQDCLGEIHDLDVLWDTAKQVHAFGSQDQRNHWLEVIRAERQSRLDKYRGKMLGRQSLWHEWRQALPVGEHLHQAVIKYFETWTFFRDHDISHSERVLAASLDLYDWMVVEGKVTAHACEEIPLRDLLRVAVLTHAIKDLRQSKQHKAVVHLLQQLEPPPGWSHKHLQLVGLIARYHRGSLPNDSQRRFAALTDDEKALVKLLGGIIRLADSFDSSHDGQLQRLKVGHQNGFMLIRAVGYNAGTKNAQKVAAARHLLESAVGLPILVTGE